MECDFQLKGAAAFPDSLDRGTGAGEPIDEGPVVRPKVSTPRAQPVDVNFMEEMRDFMRHSKRTEEMLCEQIRQLKDQVQAKPVRDWMSEEQSSQHYALLTPAHPQVKKTSTSTPMPVTIELRQEPRIPDFREGEDAESFFVTLIFCNITNMCRSSRYLANLAS